MEHYLYIHYNKETKEPFYIGKGNGKRYKQKTGRNIYWKRIVDKYGFYSEIHSYYDTHEEALLAEIALIKECRNKGITLCNFTNGGEGMLGYEHTQEAKDKISMAFKNKPLSEEHKLKISEAKKGIATTVITDEIKRKISQANKGKLSGNKNPGYKGKIKVVNILTLETFILDSLKETKALGCSPGTVSLCLSGKRKTHKGFEFQWLNN